MDYLDRLRALGVDERDIELQRDAWVLVSAQVPDQIDAIIARSASSWRTRTCSGCTCC